LGRRALPGDIGPPAGDPPGAARGNGPAAGGAPAPRQHPGHHLHCGPAPPGTGGANSRASPSRGPGTASAAPSFVLSGALRACRGGLQGGAGTAVPPLPSSARVLVRETPSPRPLQRDRGVGPSTPRRVPAELDGLGMDLARLERRVPIGANLYLLGLEGAERP